MIGRCCVFKTFREESRYPRVLTPTVDQLIHYCVTIRSQRLAVQSIRGQLVVISFWLKSKGLLEYTGEFRIRKMVEGWNREFCSVVNDRQPTSSQMLSGLLRELVSICKSMKPNCFIRQP